MAAVAVAAFATHAWADATSEAAIAYRLSLAWKAEYSGATGQWEEDVASCRERPSRGERTSCQQAADQRFHDTWRAIDVYYCTHGLALQRYSKL
jgi:hypothetical protein